MCLAVVATFQVEYSSFLDPGGQATRPLPEFARDPAALIPLYRMMVLTRTFDARCIALQRTGRIHTFASSLGQEAVSIGTCSAMRPEDVLAPAYREYGGQMLRGVRMVELLLYWAGDERGMNFAGPREDFPMCVPIATQICHATGAAYAMKLRREPRVAVSIFGDGATSKGDFYESLNMAGVWKLPAVFVVSNNQWAISVPRSRQSAAQTLAQKAIAAGFEGLQVDGNDVIAVRWAVANALDKARAGGGPTLIEAITYRLGDHTTADDASRYRDAETVARHWSLEPVARLRSHLVNCGAWGKAQEEQLLAECAERVQEAVEEFLAIPAPPPEHMFDHLHAALPGALQEQRAAAIAFGPKAGAEGGGHG
jgi:2-oxoisovalerate dehydrogenase E1 component alpha subunit